MRFLLILAIFLMPLTVLAAKGNLPEDLPKEGSGAWIQLAAVELVPTTSSSATPQPTAKTTPRPSPKPLPPPYHVWQITLAALLVYLASWFLARRKKIPLMTHRMCWNVLLLASFLVTAITAILLVLRLNYGWFSRLPIDLTFWHVEVGLFMIMIAIFHALWHLPYFKGILKRVQIPN